MRPVHIVAVVLIAQTMAGCSGSPIAGPSAPNKTVTPIPSDPPKPAPIPSDPPKPVILSISPDTGSIYGGSWVYVVGEFDRAAYATVGGIRVRTGSNVIEPNKHVLFSPPHAAGVVDVVVTNPDGTSQTVVGGYTYLDPGAFDLEGAWAGSTGDGSDSWVEFTVRDHVLTSVRCTDAYEKTVEISLSQPVVNGKVEFVGDAGSFSAWVASGSDAAGTIDIAPCSGHPWEATRR